MARSIRYDYIRVIAIFFVVCIHSMGLINVEVDEGNTHAKLINAVMSIISCGVPLFVMLSGALLLGKVEPVTIFLKKRLARVVLPFLVWSIIVGALLYYQDGGRSFWGYLQYEVKMTLTKGVHGIYWYVYAIIGLYFLTPVLRILINSRRGGEWTIIYISVLTLLVTIVGNYFPEITLLSNWTSKNMPLLFYYVFGYYIASIVRNGYNTFNFKIFFLVIFPLFYAVDVFLTYNSIEIFGMNVLLSVSIFGLLLTLPISNQLNQLYPFRHIIIRIAKYSYGIYLSHFVIISAILKTGIPHRLPITIEPLLMAVVVMAIETMMMYIIDKLNVGKYFM